MRAAPRTPEIIVGDMAPERVKAAIDARNRIYAGLIGVELIAALDGLISAWLSLSVAYHDTAFALAAAKNLVCEIERLVQLETPAGSA